MTDGSSGPEGSAGKSDPRPTHHVSLSRRSFLAGATAIVAGGAVVALVRHQNSSDGGAVEVAGATAVPSTAPTHAPARARGGTLRAYTFDAQPYDALDPHLTQGGPIANLHAAVFSRLLRYADESIGTFAPDLAAAMPEQPDETTYVFQIRDGVRFHDSEARRRLFPATAGRLLTADDVRLSIERQRNGVSPQTRRFFRHDQWDVIDRIEVPDARTLVIHTREPIAPLLAFLAGRHAFIVPREIVGLRDEIASQDALIGTGPFMLDSFEERVALRLVRNPEWFARDDLGDGDGRPYIDAYHSFFTPQEDPFQRAAFDRRIVDSTSFVDPAQLSHTHATNLADISLEEVDSASLLAMRLLLDRPPFRDDRARRALHLAIDRAALVEMLFPSMEGRPSAKLTGPIAPGAPRWAGDAETLARKAGYRRDAAGRDQDVREAKALWTAALGAAPVDLRLVAAGIPRSIPDRAIEALRSQLRDVLGANLVHSVDLSGTALIASALRRNLEGATEGAVTCTLAIEDGGVDLDEWLYPHFRSGAPMNTYRVEDPQLDSMLDKQRREMDSQGRREIGVAAQEYLVANVNARLEICAPVERRLTWGYVRNGSIAAGHGSTQDLANVWLEAGHRAFQRRPANVP